MSRTGRTLRRSPAGPFSPAGVLFVVGLVGSGSLLAADWPSFRGSPTQTGVATDPLPAELELVWSVDFADGIPGTAAIRDGRVYVGTLGGHVVCLSLEDGSEQWRFSTPEETNFRPGFTSAATATEDTVNIGDEDGTMYSLARDDGTLRWKKETGDQIVGGATAITVAGEERILFGSHDATLYCVRAKDGADVWSVRTEGPVNCSVAVVEGENGLRTFVTGCDEQFRVLDAETGEEVGRTPTGSPLIASPAVFGSDVYFGSYAGDIRGLNFDSLKQDWLVGEGTKAEPIHSSAAVTEEAVVIGGRDRRIQALSRTTGEPLWEVKTRSKVDSSPVVAPTEGGDLRVYVGTNDKRVLGIDLKSGEVVWEYRTKRPVSSSPAVAGGRLVIGVEGPEGQLLCFGKK